MTLGVALPRPPPYFLYTTIRVLSANIAAAADFSDGNLGPAGPDFEAAWPDFEAAGPDFAAAAATAAAAAAAAAAVGHPCLLYTSPSPRDS